jgi:hypothetical protein
MYTHQQTQMQYCKQAILNQNICNGNQKFHDQTTLKHSRVQLARQIAQATRLLQEAPMLQEKEARGNYRRNKVRGDVTNGKVQRQINKQKIHQRHRQENRSVSGEHPKKTHLEYYMSKQKNKIQQQTNCQNCQMCHKQGNKKGKRHQGAGQMQQKRRKSRGTGQMQQQKVQKTDQKYR